MSHLMFITVSNASVLTCIISRNEKQMLIGHIKWHFRFIGVTCAVCCLIAWPVVRMGTITVSIFYTVMWWFNDNYYFFNLLIWFFLFFLICGEKKVQTAMPLLGHTTVKHVANNTDLREFIPESYIWCNGFVMPLRNVSIIFTIFISFRIWFF